MQFGTVYFLLGKIVRDIPRCQFLRRERHVKVVIEIAAKRGHPFETPTQPSSQPQHKMIDDQLAAAFKQFRERNPAPGPLKNVWFTDPYPRKFPALCVQLGHGAITP